MDSEYMVLSLHDHTSGVIIFGNPVFNKTLFLELNPDVPEPTEEQLQAYASRRKLRGSTASKFVQPQLDSEEKVVEIDKSFNWTITGYAE